jgi:hypothetical protein
MQVCDPRQDFTPGGSLLPLDATCGPAVSQWTAGREVLSVRGLS